jgi:hypothetical protein
MTFDEWFMSEQGNFYEGQWSFAKAAWNAADRKAREECATICDQLKHSEAWECAEEIRKTIK